MTTDTQRYDTSWTVFTGNDKTAGDEEGEEGKRYDINKKCGRKEEGKDKEGKERKCGIQGGGKGRKEEGKNIV